MRLTAVFLRSIEQTSGGALSRVDESVRGWGADRCPAHAQGRPEELQGREEASLTAR